MKKGEDQASYCIGLKAGKDLKAQFPDVKAELMIEGFTHGIMGENQKITDEQLVIVLKKLQEEFSKQQQTQFDKVALQNKEACMKFLEKNKKVAGVKTLDSGLQYRVINEGKGTLHPTINSGVEMHYTLKNEAGQIIDSSHKTPESAPSQFMVNQVIPGWTEILPMMKEGDKWEVVIPFYLAYGIQGYPPAIGPNQMLIFEMELVKVHGLANVGA